MFAQTIRWPKELFITGTDTGVGKTHISSMLMQELKGGYWKPIQSGIPTDKEVVQKKTLLPSSHFFSERYILKEPLSPHLSSYLENINIELNDFTLPNYTPLPHLIIEGAGGVLVPINSRGDLMIDLIKKFKIPALVIARSTLGTINHTLMTIEALRNRDISIFGVVLNGPINIPNKEAIERFGRVPVIAEVTR